MWHSLTGLKHWQMNFGDKVSSIPGSDSTDLDSVETGWAITEQY